MGKVRVKTLGDEDIEKKQKKADKKRQEAKKLAEKAAGVVVEEPKENVEEVVKVEEVEKGETEKTEEKKVSKKEKFQKNKKAGRSKQYQAVVKLVDKKKLYPLAEAVAILPKLQRAKFDETVELHINTHETGINGNVTLPHGTGKKTRVVIATDALIADIEKGIIAFDILVAEPQMMPKLAKVAKILGPRGLMPNPKNGTVTTKPQDVVKQYEGGQISFKTESKTPVIHLSVGKVSFGDKKLTENIQTAIQAVQTKNIINVTLKSTMSPGLRIQI